MEQIKKKFERIKNSNNVQRINEFLIELSRNPKSEYLEILDHFMKNRDPNILDNIKLNLIFILGEIGKIHAIDTDYINYLIDQYQKSDRWVRNEIMTALQKIMHNSKLPDSVFDILKYSMVDDYYPIQKNSLIIMKNLGKIPEFLYKNLLRVLNSTESEIFELMTGILKKFIKNEDELFEILNIFENYKVLNKTIMRTLLIIFFSAAINLRDLDNFRSLISNSDWEEDYKKDYLQEIDTFQKILIKNL
ncbi:MAG: hypothetical protein EU539_05250 [Promethearchaeota archaeon]|nr:MAG: hypothetical protein EU539_05250 [Candidatus Lokiarchaeota archaeon]